LKKFKIAAVKQQADGLWLGEVEFFNAEPTIEVPKDLISAQKSFERLIESFKQQGLTEQDLPFIRPYQLDDCAWLANRWSELLSLPLIQKQRLLDLESPLIRLELINDILNQDIKKTS
jgi:Lon protease-like protein